MAGIVACGSCGKKNRLPASAPGTPRCASCHADLARLVEAREGDFAAAADSRVPVLVDLWAPWCGPCRMVAPGVDRAAAEFAGRLNVVKVNVDDAPGVSARLDELGRFHGRSATAGHGATSPHYRVQNDHLG